MIDQKDLVAAELARLRNDYLARLPGEIADLGKLAHSLTSDEAARATLEELHQRLHKLTGSGGTYGLKRMSAESRILESTVKAWLGAPPNTISESALKSFAEGVDALHGTLAEAATATTQAPGTASADRHEEVESRVHVWLVEDDLNLGKTLVQLVGQFGYDVRLFTRLDEAEAAIQLSRPDILILDVMFPDEGADSTEVLLTRPAFKVIDCPILFISAYGDFQSRVRAARLGAEGFLLKPLDVPQLVDRMERIFDSRSPAHYRVLIVDDDVELSNHYRLVLANVGMEVSVLNRPEEILDEVSIFRPELVLMDMHMPDYIGPELATVIRHHDEWLGLPIVYLSAETDLDLQLEAMNSGADDFLTKPISDQHLVSAVRVRAIRSRQLADLMFKDSLTGLLKHSRIKEEIGIELSRAQRSGKPMSVAMVDIDHFKSVNDTYGHAVGNRVIKAIAHLLRQRLRKSDSIGRYGGEEFVALLPECDIETARGVIEDIRERFSGLRFHHEDQEFSCTLSAGIACSALSPKASGDELLVAADEALYEAKHGGRNQVRLADSG